MTGELSTSSAVIGTYTFTLMATNNIGSSNKTFTLEVKTPSIINDATIYAKLGEPFSITFAGGGQPPFTFT